MPRARKPQSLKVVSGTVQPCRARDEVELPPVLETPPAPVWLPNAHAVHEWRRLAPILVANRLLTEGGLGALGALCGLHGQLVEMWSAGDVPPATMIAQYRGLVNDFGLTPVSQGKVRQVGEPPAKNAFSANGQRNGPRAA